MGENKNYQCTTCEKRFESPRPEWYAFDIQHGKEQLYFCSAGCLSSWVTKKWITMGITLALGVLLTALTMGEMGSTAIMLLFIPYMLRQVGGKLKGIAAAGWFGEFISLFIILMGSLTIIYPAIVLIQEIKEYLRIREVLNNHN